MSRSAVRRRRRLRLFDRGNTVCPLCLRAFSRDEAESGQIAQLEHALAKKALGGRPDAICLTCDRCNGWRGTAKIEQLVGRFERCGPDVDIDIPSFGRPEILKATVGGSPLELTLTVRVPDDPTELEAFRAAFRPGLRVPFANVTFPHPQVAHVPYLKAAYLAVFSLLGRYGVSYARSSGGELVREQIRRPAARLLNILVHHPDAHSSDLGDDFVAISRTYGCWIVRMSGRVVLIPPPVLTDCAIFRPASALPGGWSLACDLSERVDLAWPVQEFGCQPVGICRPASISGGIAAIRRACGGRLFGSNGECQRDGIVYKFAATDLMGEFIPLVLGEWRRAAPVQNLSLERPGVVHDSRITLCRYSRPREDGQ